MQNITFTSFNLLLISLFLPLWQIHIGIMISVYQVFGLIFISFFLLNELHKDNRIYLPSIAKNLIYFILLAFSIKAFSFFTALNMSLTNFEYLEQFGKGILFSLFNTVLIITIILYLNSIDKNSINKIINLLMIIALLACFYQFTQLTLLLFYKIDLDKIIWPFISFNYPEDAKTISDGILGTSTNNFFRSGSFFGNPNTFAGFLIVSMSLFISSFLKKKEFIFFLGFFIILISLMLTISRSGLLGLIIFLTLFFIVNFLHLLSKYKLFLVMIFFCSFFILFYYAEDLFYWTLKRTDFSNNLLGPRALSYSAAIDMISRYPLLGVGYNNSPILFDEYTISTLIGRDIHNYYLENFVNLGIIGGLIVFSPFMYMILFLKKRGLASGSVISLISIMVMSLLTNFLDQTFISMYIFILFIIGVIQHNNSRTSRLKSN